MRNASNPTKVSRVGWPMVGSQVEVRAEVRVGTAAWLAAPIGPYPPHTSSNTLRKFPPSTSPMTSSEYPRRLRASMRFHTCA